MKRILAVLSSFVLFAALGHAQNCGAISDEAGKIDNPAAVNDAGRDFEMSRSTITWSQSSKFVRPKGSQGHFLSIRRHGN